MMSRFKLLGLFGLLSLSVMNCFCLDREAFTFTNYDLEVRLEPEQQRLAVRGKITLRNDSAIPQKTAVLQISSSLDWLSIKLQGKPLQFVSQTYTSDVDHTGMLSEAIITLPSPIEPRATIEIDVAYDGMIVLDATRLTRMGAPEATAESTDWDQISPKFTAVRGLGNVTWYPVATEAASLREGDDLSEIVGRWNVRHAESKMELLFDSLDQTILCSGWRSGLVVQHDPAMPKAAAFTVPALGHNPPVFAVGKYQQIEVKGLSTVNYFPGSEVVAHSFAEALEEIDPLPIASGPRRLQVVQLPMADATEVVAGTMLLVPFGHSFTEEDRITLVYAVAKQEVHSPRPWIVEGLAHYAQVVDIEHRLGKEAALNYLRSHLAALQRAEPGNSASHDSNSEKDSSSLTHSLINSVDDLYLQSKSMWVWWMLTDLVGAKDCALLLQNYHAMDDKEPSYLQRVLQAQTQRDLEWFFDDWVYRDRGLPDFKIESAYTRKTLPKGYMVTVTVANLGTAGAEVPLTVKFAGGEVTKRLLVRGKSNTVIRVEISSLPAEIVVNDGSVPESDMTNNSLKVKTADAAE